MPDSATQPVNDRWLWIWYTPYGLGGVENFLNMITSQQCGGATHFIAAVQTLDGPLKSDYAKQKTTVIDWCEFYSAYMRRSPVDPACQTICRAISEIQPSVVMLNGCTDFGIGSAHLLQQVSKHAHIVDTFHIDPVDDSYLQHRRPYLHLLDGVVSSNAGVFSKLRRMYPKHKDLPSAYIPYAANVASTERTTPTNRLKLLYLGRLEEQQKRVSLLPAILSTARQLGADFRLTVAGDGPERTSLQDAFSRAGLTDAIQFLGYVPQERASELLREHDCLLNVSLFEGFSISVIEALAAGCVPICTRLENMDFNVLRDKENCLLFDIDKPLRMAEIIAGLKPPMVVRLSENAIEAGRQFTPARMANAYDCFIQQLRHSRPLLPYPADGIRQEAWDMTRGNPWLFRTHPIKKFIKSVWNSLK